MSTVQRPYWEDRAKRAERELAEARAEIERLRCVPETREGMNDIVSLDRHPILMQAYEVCQAIEECGCSKELTAAVTKASGLLDALKPIVVEIERIKGERDRQYDYNVEQIAKQAALEAEIEQWRKSAEAFAIRVLGQERYDNSPCQANPLELIELHIEKRNAAIKPLRAMLANTEMMFDWKEAVEERGWHHEWTQMVDALRELDQ